MIEKADEKEAQREASSLIYKPPRIGTVHLRVMLQIRPRELE
jgi:hypothetical protein